MKETTETNIPGFEIAVTDDLERDYKVNTYEGEVIGIGPTAWQAYDYWTPDGKRNQSWVPWCKVGDQVYYAKYAAKWIEIDGEDFVVVNDQDIIGVINE